MLFVHNLPQDCDNNEVGVSWLNDEFDMCRYIAAQYIPTAGSLFCEYIPTSTYLHVSHINNKDWLVSGEYCRSQNTLEFKSSTNVLSCNKRTNSINNKLIKLNTMQFRRIRFVCNRYRNLSNFDRPLNPDHKKDSYT